MTKVRNKIQIFRVCFVVAFLALILSPFALQTTPIKQIAINIDAKLYSTLFAHSITDQVVIGKSGWQYFGGELEHYQNRNPLSNRSIKNIVHNIKIIQDYYTSNGSNFVATIAPNKSSLYDDNMPYYIKSGNSLNKMRFESAMREAGVNYVDLFDLFDSSHEVLYFDKDSHWNDKGAALVADKLSEALGDGTEQFSTKEMIERSDFVGDIEAMLNTIDPSTSANYYVEGINDGENRSGDAWEYTYGSSVEDGEIDATSNLKNSTPQTLLMYRDSFGNNLLPFMAAKYKNSTFTKMIPYASYSGADSVILERSERQIYYLCQVAPLFESPKASELTVDQDVGKNITDDQEKKVEVDEDFVKISSFEKDCTDFASFFVRVRAGETTGIYSTFWLSGDSDLGWQVNLDKDEWLGKDIELEVIKQDESGLEIIHEYKISI